MLGSLIHSLEPGSSLHRETRAALALRELESRVIGESAFWTLIIAPVFLTIIINPAAGKETPPRRRTLMTTAATSTICHPKKNIAVLIERGRSPAKCRSIHKQVRKTATTRK